MQIFIGTLLVQRLPFQLIHLKVVKSNPIHDILYLCDIQHMTIFQYYLFVFTGKYKSYTQPFSQFSHRFSSEYLTKAVFSIWCVQLQTHTRAHTPLLVWCVLKIPRTTSVYDTYCLGHWNEEDQRKTEDIRLSSWSSFFNLG